MKLLLDENLSRKIVPFLQALYPGSSQVVLEGLERTDDPEIWQYAREHGFVIVTRDSDFQELSLLRGAPPKIIWLRTGNVSKARVIQLLTDNHEAITTSLAEPGKDCVELE